MINNFINKRTFLFLLVCILPFALCSCSNKERTQGPQKPTKMQAEKISESALLGGTTTKKDNAWLSTLNKVKCNIIMTRTDAWSGHSVTVQMINYDDRHVITTFELPATKGTQKSINTVIKSFDCQKYQQLQFIAEFSPVVWKANRDKKYLSHHVYNIAATIARITSKNTKLTLKITFPNDFIGIPELITN